jgi:RimJ/RimL family protein N-acetyltransferase
MTNSSRTVRLRDGGELTCRPARAGDEQALLAFFRALPEEDRQFLRHDVTDPAVIRRWMGSIDLDRVFPLLALSGDEIVGDATLQRYPYGWSKHVGEIRVVVAKAWQRRGVAGVLVHELVGLAQEWGLELLEAQVLEGQHGAQRCMEALGFRVETALRGRAKDQSGRRRNVLVMINDVAELWRQMEDLVADLELSEPSRD